MMAFTITCRVALRLRRGSAPHISFQTLRHSSSGKLLQSYMVTPKELAAAFETPQTASKSRIIPLCASWFLPNDPQGRTGLQVFKEKRIPSARFFDLDAIRDHDSQYPHMLPTAEYFAQAMRDMGIRKNDEVVVYDSVELGLFSAPRVGWTMEVFGHPKVHILNNFKLWVEQGYPTESGEPRAVVEEKGDYPIPDFNPDMVVKFAEMREIAKDYGQKGAEEIQVLDARSRGRWAGTEPEPRPGLSSGHMPGSISVPIGELLDPKSKTLLPGSELKKIFENKGIDPAKPIISSCGTGVTAAVIDAALKEAHFGSKEDRRLYDGSWT